MIGGTRTPIYCDRLNTKDKFSKTVIHEIGHLLRLEHPFDHGTVNFLQGYTDFFMDYEHDALGNSNGSVIANKVRFSKTEWDSIN